MAEYSELKWRCRRGMLELDILLNTYLDKTYHTMSQQQGAVFTEVLDYPDQVLLDLLLGNMRSSNTEINSLVADIQQAIRP
jgi:antitoxin CptB